MTLLSWIREWIQQKRMKLRDSTVPSNRNRSVELPLVHVASPPFSPLSTVTSGGDNSLSSNVSKLTLQSPIRVSTKQMEQRDNTNVPPPPPSQPPNPPRTTPLPSMVTSSGDNSLPSHEDKSIQPSQIREDNQWWRVRKRDSTTVLPRPPPLSTFTSNMDSSLPSHRNRSSLLRQIREGTQPEHVEQNDNTGIPPASSPLPPSQGSLLPPPTHALVSTTPPLPPPDSSASSPLLSTVTCIGDNSLSSYENKLILLNQIREGIKLKTVVQRDRAAVHTPPAPPLSMVTSRGDDRDGLQVQAQNRVQLTPRGDTIHWNPSTAAPSADIAAVLINVMNKRRQAMVDYTEVSDDCDDDRWDN
ncbi:neural Wiskott-Aldrich syndrome protein-like [Solea senegalensis]|uniref:Neural Wiskott-Aldrich syndrome protein-like n=1 Tax=Solea senegalensis TaxID=28829 RepID=A0AAV6T6Y0_SOLSE|nr:neural Wiskott-Aldrich syndrome protein-like [Solea senegalensis]